MTSHPHEGPGPAQEPASWSGPPGHQPRPDQPYPAQDQPAQWSASVAAPPNPALRLGPPAPMGRRLAALLLDGLLLLAVVLVFWAPAVLLSTRDQPGGGTLSGPLGSGSGLAATLFGLGTLAYVAYPWLTQWVLTHTHGGTPGKLLLGLQVVDVGTGGRLPLGKAFLRVLVVAGLGLLFPFGTLVDAVVAFTDPARQSVHDKAAGSVVLRRDPARAATDGQLGST